MSDPNAPGTPGQGPDPSIQTPPTGAPPAPAASHWLGEQADELTRGYVANKGWSNPMDILAAYRGAEKFISAPVERWFCGVRM